MREGGFVEQLRRFIKTAEVSFSDIFYYQYVHSLIHLSDDYLRFRSLDKVSAFQFESFLSKVKNVRPTGNKPLLQIAKHLSLLNSEPVSASDSQYPELKQQVNSTIPKDSDPYHNFNSYKKLMFSKHHFLSKALEV